MHIILEKIRWILKYTNSLKTILIKLLSKDQDKCLLLLLKYNQKKIKVQIFGIKLMLKLKMYKDGMKVINLKSLALSRVKPGAHFLLSQRVHLVACVLHSIIKKMVSGWRKMKNSCRLNHREMRDLKKFQLLKLFIGKILLIIILDSKELLSIIKKMVSGCKKMMSFYKLNQVKNQLLSTLMAHQKKFKLLKVKLGEIFITVVTQ